MKMRFTLLCCLFLVSPLLRAEGLSFNKKGELDSPHMDIALNESQKEELEALHTVTFTSEQWETLRKIAPDTPKRLEHIVPITYRDCLCDLVGVPYGVLQKNGNISIFHSPSQTAESLVWKLNYAGTLSLQIDHRGQFHMEGTLVKFPVLLEAIQKSAPLTEKRKQVPTLDGKPFTGNAYFQVPIGMEIDDAAYAERIATLKQVLTEKGWRSNGPYPPNQ